MVHTEASPRENCTASGFCGLSFLAKARVGMWPTPTTFAHAYCSMHCGTRGSLPRLYFVPGRSSPQSNAADLLFLADLWCLAAVKGRVLACLRRTACNGFRWVYVGMGKGFVALSPVTAFAVAKR